jgi:hypothetical protein
MSTVGSPEQMRDAVAAYVVALHAAYADAAALLPPAEAARLPLMATGSETTVVAAAAGQDLHLFATVEALPVPQGPEVARHQEAGPLRWTLRFYDPVVVPALGLFDGHVPPAEVRRTLGVSTCTYHLVVSPGADLGGHHALHAGTGLAHAHGAAFRDVETIRAHVHGREDLVDEYAATLVADLPRAQSLLAVAIAPGSRTVADAAALVPPDATALRRALVEAVRGRTDPA